MYTYHPTKPWSHSDATVNLIFVPHNPNKEKDSVFESLLVLYCSFLFDV